MSCKIVYVTTNPEKVSDEDQIISRKALNALMEEGWEITAEDENPTDEEIIKTKLERPENAVAVRQKTGVLSSPKGPDRGTEAIQGAFGMGEGPEPGQQLISALEGVSKAVSAGGSHLGGGVTRCIPGVGIVSAQEVGMARDSGVHAGMMGWGEDQCPFPKGSRPWHLWMEGWKQGNKQMDKVLDKDWSKFAMIREEGFDTYLESHKEDNPGSLITQDEYIAYNQGWSACEEAAAEEAAAKETGQEGYNAEVLCPYTAGPSYLCWIMGFKDAGGEIDIA